MEFFKPKLKPTFFQLNRAPGEPAGRDEQAAGDIPGQVGGVCRGAQAGHPQGPRLQEALSGGCRDDQLIS